MRFALCKWKAGPLRAGQPGWVPDCGLVGQPGFGVIDLRGPNNLDGSGFCIAVDSVGSTAIPGALVDLGTDLTGKLPAAVSTAIGNRLGLNLTETTVGRVAAEMLIVWADGNARCLPLQAEVVAGTLRRRITAAGVTLYDSLAGDPGVVNYYASDVFNRPNATLAAPWSDPSASSPIQVVSSHVEGQFLNGSWGRWDQDVGSADMYAQADYTTVTGSSGGPCIRFSSSAVTCYQFDWQVTGGDYVRWAANAYNYISTPTGSLAGTSGVAATLYLQQSGSTLTVKVNGNAGSTQTDTNITGNQRGGLLLIAATTLSNSQVDNFATARIGESALVFPTPFRRQRAAPVRRAKTQVPTQAQTVVSPTFVRPRSRPNRRVGVLARRGKLTVPVTTQAAAVPPVWRDPWYRSAKRFGTLARRTKTSTAVPALTQAQPPPPLYVQVPGRAARRAASMVRRAKITAPPIDQTRPPFRVLARRSPKVPVKRTEMALPPLPQATIPPPSYVQVPGRAPRRVVSLVRRGKPSLPPIPQALVPPSYVQVPARAAKRVAAMVARPRRSRAPFEQTLPPAASPSRRPPRMVIRRTKTTDPPIEQTRPPFRVLARRTPKVPAKRTEIAVPPFPQAAPIIPAYVPQPARAARKSGALVRRTEMAFPPIPQVIPPPLYVQVPARATKRVAALAARPRRSRAPFPQDAPIKVLSRTPVMPKGMWRRLLGHWIVVVPAPNEGGAGQAFLDNATMAGVGAYTPGFAGTGTLTTGPAVARVVASFAAASYVFSGPQYQAGDSSIHDPRAAIREGVGGTANQLGKHYNRSLSISVLKIAGTYTAIPNPSLAQIASATEVYMGGRDYPVTLATKLALEAAGFTVKTVFEHVE